MAFTEDLSAFLDTDGGFAVEATYDGGTIVEGIFDNGYAEAPVGLVGVGGTVPRFLCRTEDVADDPAGDSLVVEDVSYTIVRGEPDGDGMTWLVLEAA